MKKYLLPALLMSLLTAACGNPDGPDVGASRQPVATLEQMIVDAPIIRGFVADGTGCATIGEPVINGNTITFILTDYIAEKEGTGLARATCDIAVEIDLPAGVTLSLDNVIYRGFADGSLSRSTFFREYFFAGMFLGDRRFTVIDYNAIGTPIVIRNDSDDYMSDFGEFTALDEVLSVGASPCGEPAIWRANTSLSVRNNAAGSFSLSSIDTVDVQNQYFITFDFGLGRNC
jgi:hypothetical protein